MKKILKHYFGYDEFRPLQAEIIENVLSKKDTFVLMPTGGGKSLCYQIPALKLDGLTLVISPLIALMKDQVDNLKSNGIPAEFINSSISYPEIIDIQFRILQGEIKILYIAPERLVQENFRKFLNEVNLSLIAVDEAHCISEWGHNFRPNYRNLETIKKYFPNIPIIALTATATNKVKEDIINQLNLECPKIFVSSFNRENLNLIVMKKKNSFDKILELINKYKNKSVIIYCFSRKETEIMANKLKENGHKALFYHAGLNDKSRKLNQELFLKDEVNIIVATIAFGMGIDKSNVRMVIHCTFPKTLEGYYQEIGRAGRDGLKSDCIMFYSIGDKRKHDFFIDKMEDEKSKKHMQEKLQVMIDYSETRDCRRKYILKYFGEEYPKETCKGCDICLEEKEFFDAKEIANHILSCIKLTGGFFGTNYIINVLLGKGQIKEWHKKFYLVGIVKDFSDDELKDIISSLINLEFIKKNNGQYLTLSLTFKGLDFLDNSIKLELPKPQKEIKVIRKKLEKDFDYDEKLFERLRILRKKIADEREVPSFVIFSDASLQEMAFCLPKNKYDFSEITGVGKQKLEIFGNLFLNVIREYVEGDNYLEDDKTNLIKIIEIEKTEKPKLKNWEITKKMIDKKIPINEIAKKQSFTEDTIINHIGKVVDNEENIDINYLKPSKEKFEKIKHAFEICGMERLSLIYSYLNQEFSYEDIRLVRIFMKLGKTKI